MTTENPANFLSVITKHLIDILTIYFESIKMIASKQNHRFGNENIDVVVREIINVFTKEMKNDVIEEFFYRLNNTEKFLIFEKLQKLIVL